MARIDHVVGKRGEVAAPSAPIRVASHERRFVKDNECVVVSHQLNKPGEVAAVDAVDEADRRGNGWKWLASHVPDVASSEFSAANAWPGTVRRHPRNGTATPSAMTARTKQSIRQQLMERSVLVLDHEVRAANGSGEFRLLPRE